MTYRHTLLLALSFACVFVGFSDAASAQQAETRSPVVTDAWIREAPPGARALAAFMVIVGDSDDRLIGGHSDAAERVEIHTHLHEDGLMKMRRLPELHIKAGEPVELKPGGLHLMLISPSADLQVGQAVQVTLQFEQAGEIEIQATVRAARRGNQTRM